MNNSNIAPVEFASATKAMANCEGDILSINCDGLLGDDAKWEEFMSPSLFTISWGVLIHS